MLVCGWGSEDATKQRVVRDILRYWSTFSDGAAAAGGVRHRSLFVLDDVYIHYVETDDEFGAEVDAVREHPLFKEISAKLDAYIIALRPRDVEVPQGRPGAGVHNLGPSRVGCAVQRPYRGRNSHA